MREILFRGKRVDNGEWVYGSPFIIGEENISFILNNCSTINFKDHDAEFIGFKVSRETIVQYTGLKDKNGVKIFEGDIVQVWNKPYNVSKSLVVWGVKSHGWSLKCYIIKDNIHNPAIKYYGLGNSKDIEVIGNLYND